MNAQALDIIPQWMPALTEEAKSSDQVSNVPAKAIVEREYQACAAGLQAFLICRLRDAAGR